MDKFKRYVYMSCAVLVFVVIFLLLFVHTFNHTEVSNLPKSSYVEPLKGIGC